MSLLKQGRTFGTALLILCAGSAHAAVIQIKIENLAFAPAQVSAQVGDTIEWTNVDFVAHTATARDGTYGYCCSENCWNDRLLLPCSS